ncbi:UbiA family prenyltransferase [Sphingopyxis sp.]|uniref:UbiA family prenyltransferase n=1 Tax=Sphingopyxis sp. TaxID=1908224 RepID=UPI003D6D317B
MPTRLWQYQAERFPLGKTALLVAVFSAAGVSASAHFAGRPLPGIPAFLLAFAVTLLFFFQLRVFDEVKDHEDDCLYRPERPIPRGLVSLRLIVGLGIASAGVAALACALIAPNVLPLLLLTWGWMLLMGREFFVPRWLKAHPLAYMASHMAIMPLIDLFITGIEWQPHGMPPPGLGLFLALSFVNGCILEIGRKLWAPENERASVESYSALYGPRRAISAWLLCIMAALALLAGVGFATGAPFQTISIGLVAAFFVARAGLAYRNAPTPAHQKGVDTAAGLWVFACYIAAGFAPFLQG